MILGPNYWDICQSSPNPFLETNQRIGNNHLRKQLAYLKVPFQPFFDNGAIIPNTGIYARTD
jgi:hypothetical protein